MVTTGYQWLPFTVVIIIIKLLEGVSCNDVITLRNVRNDCKMAACVFVCIFAV